jgi:hypothetical protein
MSVVDQLNAADHAAEAEIGKPGTTDDQVGDGCTHRRYWLNSTCTARRRPADTVTCRSAPPSADEGA